jgi:hypothetical protein
LSSTGSLKAGAPGGMMTDFAPPKVSGRRLPPTISEFSPAIAMLAAPIRTGLLPSSFDSRSLTLLPPMLRCTIWRIVRFERLAGITPRGACGLAVQVLIHAPAWTWALPGESASGFTDSAAAARMARR